MVISRQNPKQENKGTYTENKGNKFAPFRNNMQYAHLYVLLSFNGKCKVPHGPVSIPGNYVPDYTISSYRQAGQTHLKKFWIGRVYPAVPFVHHLIIGTVNHHRRKSRFQIAIEPYADNSRRVRNRRTHFWVRMVRERMPLRHSRQRKQRKKQ